MCYNAHILIDLSSLQCICELSEELCLWILASCSSGVEFRIAVVFYLLLEERPVECRVVEAGNECRVFYIYLLRELQNHGLLCRRLNYLYTLTLLAVNNFRVVIIAYYTHLLMRLSCTHGICHGVTYTHDSVLGVASIAVELAGFG